MNEVSIGSDGYKNNVNIDNEALKRINSEQKKRGTQLEKMIIERTHGTVNGFPGVKLYWGDKKANQNANIGYFDRNGKGLPKKSLEQLKIHGILPDVDITCINESDDVVFVISSKGNCGDANAYASAYHGQNWDFPFFVVTKDEPGHYKSGNSKYITMFRSIGNVKVFISNHSDYNKESESGKWVGYKWNDVVQPDHKLHDEIFKTIAESMGKSEFFKYEEKK
tara:strand:- start:68 stop:736 length:669 start_codon:yes stop_codon:yes gene_type:complete